MKKEINIYDETLNNACIAVPQHTVYEISRELQLLLSSVEDIQALYYIVTRYK
jgi:hypothetical protein